MKDPANWFIGLCIALLAALVLWLVVVLCADTTATRPFTAELVEKNPYTWYSSSRVGKTTVMVPHHSCHLYFEDGWYRYTINVGGYGEGYRLGANYRLVEKTKKFFHWEWKDIDFAD